MRQHHNADPFENNLPLPVEEADPPVEDVQQEAPLPDPVVHIFIIHTKPLRYFVFDYNILNIFVVLLGSGKFDISLSQIGWKS